MKIIDPYYKILTSINGECCNGEDILRIIEQAGRTCYKSENKITAKSHYQFAESILRRGHESVIEHFNISVLFVCNRGFSHELVRHRIAAFSQESTRYCNYSQDKFGNELTFIKPPWFTDLWKSHMDMPIEKWDRLSNEYIREQIWEDAMKTCERNYLNLIRYGATPQEARGVLPIDIKTEVVMTTNLREWRHVFKLRCSKAAHPSMQQLMSPLLKEFQEKIPVLFSDIKMKEN